MEPTILAGDKVFVWKPLLGARIFDIFSLLGGEDVKIYRIPGIHNMKRNDIIVFNYPYYNGLDMIKMQIVKYYIKRCIGLPGDTIFVKNEKYHIIKVQNSSSSKFDIQKKNYTEYELRKKNSYPNHSYFKKNIKDFGPLIIPLKDSEILMDYKNFILYQTLIKWETQKDLTFDEIINCCYSGQQPLKKYRFKHNYFFVIGDNLEESEDSRYWGLVPEPFIVGKVNLTLKSHGLKNNHFHRKIFKRIQ